MRARYGVVPGDMVQLSLTLAVWRPRGIRRSEHHAPHFAASPRACASVTKAGYTAVAVLEGLHTTMQIPNSHSALKIFTWLLGGMAHSMASSPGGTTLCLTRPCTSLVAL